MRRYDMRKRPIKIQIWINNIEYKKLIDDSQREKVTMSDHIRKLILGVKLKEKPGIEFYNVMNQMSRIGNNLNQIARKANETNEIDKEQYKILAEQWREFTKDVKKKFL